MRIVTLLVLLVAAVTTLAACSAAPSAPAPSPARAAASASSPNQEAPAVAEPKKDASPLAAATPGTTDVATFAAGCYWCVEAVFQRIDGVIKVRSGFTGGTVPNPSYEECCSGTTGHAEAVEITFDPRKVSYETLLDWFWRLHDPTTLNRQGADVGTQYRSAIFWHGEAQRAVAEKSKKSAQEAFKDPIVTQIEEAGAFYEAEAYHQNYYNDHSTQGYCRVVIAPKLHKLGLDEKK